MNLLKKEILNQKYLFLKYINIIPKTQLPKFEKDLETIFENFENIGDELELNKINKLATAKLKSIKRIYGEIESKQKFDMYEGVSQTIIDDLSQNYKIDDNKPNFNEIINSDGFNPILVKKYRDEYNKIAEIINKQIVGEKNDNTISDDVRFNKVMQSEEVKKQMKEVEKERMTEYFQDVSKRLNENLDFKDNNLDEAIDQLFDNKQVNKQKLEETEFLKSQEKFSGIIYLIRFERYK